MAGFENLIGVLDLYIAPYGTAEPAVTGAPSGTWIELGCSDGDQTEDHGVGDLTKFYDNCHRGPVKTVLGQQDPMFSFTMIALTLENIARIFSTVGAVVTDGTVKRLPIKRPYYQTEYAFLAKSATDSPYLAGAGQLYIPRGVFDMKFSVVRSKTGRAGFAVAFHALEDDAQADGYELGWKSVVAS
jgi:hypothetical protein